MAGMRPSDEAMALAVELRALQGGRCGICGGEATRLVLDHDHASGLVRGLLCVGCNMMEGQHGWCPSTEPCGVCAWRAAPAVSWLGRTVAYSDARPSSSWSPALERDARRVEWVAASDRRAAEMMGQILDELLPVDATTPPPASPK